MPVEFFFLDSGKMDFPIQIATIGWDCPLCFKESQVDIPINKYTSESLKIAFCQSKQCKP